jgi:geranylgeranyl pyrophosphate synthase
LSSDCRNTSVDEEWVSEMIRIEHQAPRVHTRSYVHLMRAAEGMFEREELPRLAPRTRGKTSLAELNGQGISGLDPVAGTETIAYDFLAKGGKHSRPFITLAVYDALTGGEGTLAGGAEHVAGFSDAVKRAALSIETFHKASLVHDDIEDDDAFRYGDETIHRRFGVPSAINVGDYLIGLGYRLVSRESGTLGAEVVADILDHLADAHMKLCEGQGAELLWRDSRNKRLAPLDALKIYALKTAPAFDAALFCGARLAGDAKKYAEPLAQFARHLGVAFQILNDLDDWEQDSHNKLAAGGDVLGGRPTVLWALALESLQQAQRNELETLVTKESTGATLARTRELYQTAGVFEKAHLLVDKYQQRAEAVADEIEPDELRRLMYYLVDTVLARTGAEVPVAAITGSEPALPIVAPS